MHIPILTLTTLPHLGSTAPQAYTSTSTPQVPAYTIAPPRLPPKQASATVPTKFNLPLTFSNEHQHLHISLHKHSPTFNDQKHSHTTNNIQKVKPTSSPIAQRLNYQQPSTIATPPRLPNLQTNTAHFKPPPMLHTTTPKFHNKLVKTPRSYQNTQNPLK